MSVKELSLEDKDFNCLNAYKLDELLRIGVNSGIGEHGIINLDLNQAQLLYLFLREYLKS